MSIKEAVWTITFTLSLFFAITALAQNPSSISVRGAEPYNHDKQTSLNQDAKQSKNNIKNIEASKNPASFLWEVKNTKNNKVSYLLATTYEKPEVDKITSTYKKYLKGEKRQLLLEFEPDDSGLNEGLSEKERQEITLLVGSMDSTENRFDTYIPTSSIPIEGLAFYVPTQKEFHEVFKSYKATSLHEIGVFNAELKKIKLQKHYDLISDFINLSEERKLSLPLLEKARKNADYKQLESLTNYDFLGYGDYKNHLILKEKTKEAVALALENEENFIIIHAAHFNGKESIIQHLERQGYQVRPITP